MASAVQHLLSVIDLEPLEVNLFRGRSPQSGWQRVFGGQVIGQALTTLVAGDWLAQGCLAVLERPSQASWRWPPGWESVTDRRYGDTRIWQGVLVASEAPSA